VSRRSARGAKDPAPAGASSARPRIAAPDAARSQFRWWPLYLALITAVVFLPALECRFVNWDDDRNIVYNTAYRGLGDKHVAWALTTSLMGHYIPVTWLSFGLDYTVWGMRPFGYHLTNLLLHAANVAVFYLVALRLLWAARAAAGPDLGLRLGAAVAALLFAVHPLRVESVAWITERRDVLSALFYLFAVLAYLRACERAEPSSLPRQGGYWLALGLFAMALLSKSMAVSLPVVLLVLDVYPLRRLGGRPGGWLGPAAIRVWAEKLPFALLSLGASAVALVALDSVRGVRPIVALGLGERVAISVYSLAFYLWKTLAPSGLAPLYELPIRVDPLTWPYLLSGGVVAGVTVAALWFRRRWPALLAVWVSYVAILLPVLGIVQNGPQIAADRYTYLASLGWAALIGGLVRTRWGARSWAALAEPRALAASALAVAVLAVLSVLTWRQVGVWRDSGALWRHALAHAPSALAHNNLGAFRAGEGDFAGAAEEYRRALGVKPDYADAWSNLGVALAKQGQLDEGVKALGEAVRIKPDSPELHFNLGRGLTLQGRPQEAAAHYRRAAALRPGYREAEVNLDRVLTGGTEPK
jgi:protein O-mannosyl-transferase